MNFQQYFYLILFILQIILIKSEQPYDIKYNISQLISSLNSKKESEILKELSTEGGITKTEDNYSIQISYVEKQSFTNSIAVKFPQVNITHDCIKKIKEKYTDTTDIIVTKLFTTYSLGTDSVNYMAGITRLTDVLYYQFFPFKNNIIDISQPFDISSECSEDVVIFAPLYIDEELKNKFVAVAGQNPKSDFKSLRNYDIFDPNAKIYKDICYPITFSYASEIIINKDSFKNLDITLQERKKHYFPGNLALCPEGCLYLGTDKDTVSTMCQCEFNNKYSLSGNEITVHTTYTNFTFNEKKFNKTKKDNYFSMETFKCVKLPFTKSGLKGNYGSIIMIAIICIVVLCYIILIVSGKYHLLSVLELLYNSNIKSMNYIKIPNTINGNSSPNNGFQSQNPYDTRSNNLLLSSQRGLTTNGMLSLNGNNKYYNKVNNTRKNSNRSNGIQIVGKNALNKNKPQKEKNNLIDVDEIQENELESEGKDKTDINNSTSKEKDKNESNNNINNSKTKDEKDRQNKNEINNEPKEVENDEKSEEEISSIDKNKDKSQVNEDNHNPNDNNNKEADNKINKDNNNKEVNKDNKESQDNENDEEDNEDDEDDEENEEDEDNANGNKANPPKKKRGSLRKINDNNAKADNSNENNGKENGNNGKENVTNVKENGKNGKYNENNEYSNGGRKEEKENKNTKKKRKSKTPIEIALNVKDLKDIMFKNNQGQQLDNGNKKAPQRQPKPQNTQQKKSPPQNNFQPQQNNNGSNFNPFLNPLNFMPPPYPYFNNNNNNSNEDKIRKEYEDRARQRELEYQREKELANMREKERQREMEDLRERERQRQRDLDYERERRQRDDLYRNLDRDRDRYYGKDKEDELFREKERLNQQNEEMKKMREKLQKEYDEKQNKDKERDLEAQKELNKVRDLQKQKELEFEKELLKQKEMLKEQFEKEKKEIIEKKDKEMQIIREEKDREIQRLKDDKDREIKIMKEDMEREIKDQDEKIKKKEKEFKKEKKKLKEMQGLTYNSFFTNGMNQNSTIQQQIIEMNNNFNSYEKIETPQIVVSIDSIFTDQELNAMDFNNSCIYDKRTLCQVYLSYINRKHPLFFLFNYNVSSSKSISAFRINYESIKFIIFCIELMIYMFFYATFFGSKSITHIFYGRFNFRRKLIFGIILSPFCMIAKSVIHYFVYDNMYTKITEIKMRCYTNFIVGKKSEKIKVNEFKDFWESEEEDQKKEKDEKKEEMDDIQEIENDNLPEEEKIKRKEKYEKRKLKSLIKELIEILKKKVYLSFLIMIFVLFIMWYYISAFCAVYKNSQLDFFVNILISFGYSNLIPFLYCLLPTIFRQEAVKEQSQLSFLIAKAFHII